MKKMLLLVFFMGLTNLVNAQNEFLNQNNTLAPSGSSLATPKSILPSVFSPNKETKSTSSIIEKNNLNFTNSNEFVNVGDIYRDKLNKKEGGIDSKEFRKNQYLGDFKSNSAFVKISYRDFGEVDGDEIKVLVNDRVFVSRIFLDNNYKVLEIGLEKGFNKIDFEALNQGMFGPNTAQFQILDDQGNLVSANQWNLGTGFKATVIIVKD